MDWCCPMGLLVPKCSEQDVVGRVITLLTTAWFRPVAVDTQHEVLICKICMTSWEIRSVKASQKVESNILHMRQMTDLWAPRRCCGG